MGEVVGCLVRSFGQGEVGARWWLGNETADAGTRSFIREGEVWAGVVMPVSRSPGARSFAHVRWWLGDLRPGLVGVGMSHECNGNG